MDTTGQERILEVTQEHLDRALAHKGYHNNRYCLIGQAALEEFGADFFSCAGSHVRVGSDFDKNTLFRADDSERLWEFVEKFDKARKNPEAAEIDWLRQRLPRKFKLVGPPAE
jgi:hypothetical protein